MTIRRTRFPLATLLGLALLAALPVAASDTPNPAFVTVAGSLQSELGCAADWLPDCAATHLVLDAEDGVWQAIFTVPAGSWEYKAPLNNSWDENYGANAQRGGANIPLNLADDTAVKFYYDHETHWITDNQNAVIAVAPGSFQSELGCANDWDPTCLRSWLQDPDGDGTFTFRTRGLPAGSYEAKVAIAESWTENYGLGGAPNGANIAFTVPTDCVEMLFSYDGSSHVLTISVAPPAPQPASVTVAGSLQSELGCPSDWQADCAATHLSFDAEDGIWQQIFSVPAGSWEYKAPIDDSWTENYGRNAQRDGANIPLTLADAQDVKFYYDHATHWITDGVGSRIAVAPGSFQSELGCAGDWDPSCLRSWLQDPDGDGFYSFSARLPAGTYEAKVALNESWSENYGDGGAPNGANISFSVTRSCSETFFTYNDTTHVLTIGQQGGPRGNLRLAKAHWVTRDTIAWNPGPVLPGETFALHWSADGSLELGDDGVSGGSSLALTYDPAGLPAAVTAKFPHLAGLAAFKIAAGDLDEVPAILKSQMAISATSGGEPVDATALQIPGVLDDLYATSGPLGVTFSGSVPTLRVWAPTAHTVRLHLFNDANPATPATVVPMTVNPATGVWSAAGTTAWNRKFYLYEVEVFARSTGEVETNLVTDPYSLSLAADSARSQIVRLSDGDLKPAGWDGTPKPKLAAPEDISLYELHVRDFSISDASVPAAQRGTFKAFARTGSNGMRHLRGLADAGLTHIHLLPSFDIATVPERRSNQLSPGDLSAFPPDSDQQQAAVAAVKDQDGFNWGYDPWHYTVPEGSYATDPDGPARIREFREMVQSLNQNGLRVVMDVVYNHTNAAGQNAKSVLDRIVPGYYHRLNANGDIEMSSCCPNTATEHDMMRKLMVDSVVTWARDYKVDGFRFDLMGHHMKADMLAVRAALDALTPATIGDSGVDGSKVYVYGEGWNFGEVANNARGIHATQANMKGTGIGTFCDRLRDGVRGGGPFSGLQAQGFINGLFYDPNGTDQGDQLGALLRTSDWIRVGLAGDLSDYQLENAAGATVAASQIDYNGQQAGYTADPQEKITYIEAHDNETLFDAIQLKAPVAASLGDRVRMQNLGLSVVALSQGVPFFHAGTDLLRSKSIDRDSFNSGDWFNRLDWTYQSNNWGVGLPPAEKNQANWPLMQPLLANPALKPGKAQILDAAAHFREMLRIRTSSRLFRLRTAAEVVDHLRFVNTGPGQLPGLIAMDLTDDSGAVDRKRERVVVLFNARDEAASYTLADAAGRRFGLHPLQRISADPVVRTSSFTRSTGTFQVPARTTAVFVAYRPAVDQLDLLAADVEALETAGVLSHGQATSLQAKLTNAARQIERGQTIAALANLGAFVLQVQALVHTGALTADQGQALTVAAADVIETLVL
jgi:pullulanase